MSWVPSSGRRLSSLTCSLLTTEQEAPESNNSGVCWLLILPEMYAGMCCVVRGLTTVRVPLVHFPAVDFCSGVLDVLGSRT